MDALPPRFIAQRRFRLFRCPCPECANHFYYCPFRVDYKLGGQIPGPQFICDPPVRPANAALWDAKDYARICMAYSAEFRNAIGSPTLGVTLARTASRLPARFRSWFAHPDICTAWQRALTAFGHAERDPAAALRGAEAALSVSAQCPDAYYLLGRFKAKSYEEALELFNRGANNYLSLLSPDGWARCWKAYPHLVTAPPLQGAARCMVGAVQTLCRMRRGAEAYLRMQKMLQVAPPLRELLTGGYCPWEPVLEVWALAPEVVYRAKGPAACLAWLHKHFVDEVMDVGGAAVWWVATYALAWAATHQQEGFKWSSLALFEDEAVIMGLPPDRSRHGSSGSGSSGDSECDGGGGSGGSESCSGGTGGSRPCERDLHRRRVLTQRRRGAALKLRNGLALAACCSWLPNLVDMLLGDMPLPPGPLPPMCLHHASLAAQVSYVRYCGDLWRSTPGVLDFVRRYRNTYEVFCIVTDLRTGREASMDDFRRYMAPFRPAAVPSATKGGASAAVAASAAAAAKPSSGSPKSGSGSGSFGSNEAPLPQAVGIFPDGLMYEGYGGWHGLVEMACTFTCHHAQLEDPTMAPQDLEVLRALLAAGCPVDASKRRPPSSPGPIHSPLLVALHRGYGPEAVRELLRAGADPLEADASGGVPLLNGAEQGMWRELQAVFKARRKLGPAAPPPHLWPVFANRSFSGRMMLPRSLPRTLFEMLFEVALCSSGLICLAGGVKGCFRCVENDEEDLSGSPHGPWCNFSKVVEVLVAYGMTRVSEQFLSHLYDIAVRLEELARAPRLQLLEHLRGLLREAEAGSAAGTATKSAGTQQNEQGNEQQPQPQPQTETGKKKEKDKDEKTQHLEGSAVQGQQQHQKSTGEDCAVVQKNSQKQQQQQQQQANGTLQQQADGTLQQQQPGNGAAGSGATAPPQSRKPSGGSGDAAAAVAAAAEVAAAVSELRLRAPPGERSRCCWACGKEKDRAAGVKLRKCSTCCVARYCGAECQRQHWSLHRQECKQLAAAAGATEGAAGRKAEAKEKDRDNGKGKGKKSKMAKEEKKEEEDVDGRQKTQ